MVFKKDHGAGRKGYAETTREKITTKKMNLPKKEDMKQCTRCGCMAPMKGSEKLCSKCKKEKKSEDTLLGY